MGDHHDSDGVDDAALIIAIRAGDEDAFEELYRRHQVNARRYAVRLVGEDAADDLVSEAFSRIVVLFRRHDGPSTAFHSYLRVVLRNVHIDRWRRSAPETPVGDGTAEVFRSMTVEDLSTVVEDDTIIRAFRTLPERWQEVLWATEIRGEPYDDVGSRLDINANSVAALAFRAREGLRLAYLAEHVVTTDPPPECRRTVDHLPRYVRGALGPARSQRVQIHLRECASCTLAAENLTFINSNFGVVLVPVLIGVLGFGAAQHGEALAVLGSHAAAPDLILSHLSEPPTAIGLGGMVAVKTFVRRVGGGAAIASAIVTAGVLFATPSLRPVIDVPVTVSSPRQASPAQPAPGEPPPGRFVSPSFVGSGDSRAGRGRFSVGLQATRSAQRTTLRLAGIESYRLLPGSHPERRTCTPEVATRTGQDPPTVVLECLVVPPANGAPVTLALQLQGTQSEGSVTGAVRRWSSDSADPDDFFVVAVGEQPSTSDPGTDGSAADRDPAAPEPDSLAVQFTSTEMKRSSR